MKSVKLAYFYVTFNMLDARGTKGANDVIESFFESPGIVGIFVSFKK